MDDLNIDGTKIHLHPERVAQWLSAKTIEEKMKVFPLYAEISPVGSCNERCIFCSVDYIGYKNIQLEIDALKRCISSMAKNGVKSIMYAGEGEPMLHKNISEIVNYTKESGIDVAFTTNGTLMNEKFIHECLNNITWIKVSLNAGDAETYSKVHQVKPEYYSRVWNNLSLAVEWREMNNLNVTLGVQTVLIPENIESIEGLILEASICGLDYVVLKPYSQHLSSINKYEIDYTKWDKALVEISEKFTTAKFKVIYRRTSALKKEPGYIKCFSTPSFWQYIMASGDVYSCSAYLLNEKFNLGNIHKESWENIWLGEKRRKNLEFVENELDIKDCRKLCRMDKSNEYLWQLKNPSDHVNFI